MKERLVQFKCVGSGWGNSCENKKVFNMKDPNHVKELNTNLGNRFKCQNCKIISDQRAKKAHDELAKLMIEILG